MIRCSTVAKVSFDHHILNIFIPNRSWGLGAWLDVVECCGGWEVKVVW